jgi:penicillin amidase
MKVLRRIVIAFLALVVMGFIAGGIFIKYNSQKAIPDYNKEIVFTALNNQVIVKRDSFAVPSVYAQNEADLYRTVGYVMAQDRLWQMDLLRRITTGRLSEIFGKEMLVPDQLFRSLGFLDKSELVLAACDEQIKLALEAFSEGVNQYIEDNFGKLPPEFTILGYVPEKWEPKFSVNLIGYMAWGLTLGWSTEISLYKIKQAVGSELYSELEPDMDMQREYIYPDGIDHELMAVNSALDIISQTISDLGLNVFEASNNWVVSPSKSENGQAMLANDMHLGLNAPGIWYQMHQVVPEKLNVTGVVLPGQPFVICGHNDDVAWGMTNVMLDDMDFYMETLKVDDSTKYLYNSEWKDLKIVREIIHDKSGDSTEVYNFFTHRGPAISGFKEVKDKAISMRWIGSEFSNEVRSVYLFNRMKNWEDFRNAASTFISISQNIAYADRQGNIGMQTTGGIPIRKGNGIFIAPGDTSKYDWTGIVSFEELPHDYNPPKGYLASANNRTIGDDYPYYISRWFDLPNRMEAITESLESKEKLSIEDFKAIQSKQVSKWAEKLVPYFTGLLKDDIVNQNEIMNVAYTYLDTWNYEMSVESVEATLFEQFYVEFLRAVFYDELGEKLFTELITQDMIPSYFMDKVRRTNESAWFDDVSTKDKIEDAKDIAIIALNNALNILSERLGRDMAGWEWGTVHSLSLNHPLGKVDVLNRAFKLNRGPFPVGGSYHTVSPYSYPLNDLFHADHGSSHRHIFTTGDWDKSQVIIPTGISGIPASDFYCDQTDDYLNYRYKTDYFSDSGVDNSTRFRTIFKPFE